VKLEWKEEIFGKLERSSLVKTETKYLLIKISIVGYNLILVIDKRNNVTITPDIAI